MRKITFLLSLLLAFVTTTALAQIDTNKEYRVKDMGSGYYMIAGDYEAHAGGPTGGVKFVEKTESDDQVFTVEAEGTGYKLKTKSGKYIYCQPWNVDALDQASVLTFSDNGDGTYYIMNGNKYFKVEEVGGVYYPFCDAPATAAAKFAFEEVTSEPTVDPEVPVTSFEVVSVSPSEAVSSLKELTITFNEEAAGQFDQYSMVAMKLKKDNNVASSIANYVVDGTVLTVTLSQEVTEAGEYTLVIPEGLITRKSDGAAYSGEHKFTVAEATAAPVVITDVAQLSNAKCYTIVSSDTGRGGMYALDAKVDMCGVTYAAGSDECHNVAFNAEDVKQQFAFVLYEGKHYLYSVSAKKFVMKSGDTNALVGEAPFEFVTVEKVGENTFALKANDTHYFTASPGWCSNASRGTCIQSTLTSKSTDDGWDNGAWFTITEVADFDATEALAMLAPAPVPSFEVVSVSPSEAVSSLKELTITFNEEAAGQFDQYSMVAMKLKKDNNVASSIANYVVDGAVLTVTLSQEVTEAGEYTLVIPEGLITRKSDGAAYSGEHKFTVAEATPEVPAVELKDKYTATFNSGGLEVAGELLFDQDLDGNAKAGYATLKFTAMGETISDCVAYETTENTVVLKSVTVGNGDMYSGQTKEVDIVFTVQENGSLLGDQKVYGNTQSTCWIGLDLTTTAFVPYTAPVTDEATLAAIEKAEVALAKTGVGYPAAESASRTALVAAVEEAKAAATTENGAKVNTALAAYYAETNVALPESGKAYTFTMVAKNGNKFYLNYTGEDVAMVAVNGEALPESAKFVATANGDGTYTFQTNDGKYLVYHSKYAGVNWLEGGGNTTGFQAEKDDMTNITLAKLSAAATNVAATDAQVFGLVSWYGKRGYDTGKNEDAMGYMVLKTDGTDYDGASAPFWNDNYSSAFLVEETEVVAPAVPLELVSLTPAPDSKLEVVNNFTFTFNKEVTLGENGGVVLYYNGNPAGQLAGEVSAEDAKVVNFSFGQDITYAGSYMLYVAPATFIDADGNTNEEAFYNYTVEAVPNSFTYTYANPANETNVESLKTITLGFAGEVGTISTEELSVFNADGYLVASATAAADNLDGNAVVITLDEELKDYSTYTITVPEKFFTSTTDTYNPEFTLTYTIKDPALDKAITALNQLSNNYVYTVVQKQHSKGMTSWAVAEGGEALKSNADLGTEVVAGDAKDTKQQFAFITPDEGQTYYLYHAAEQKFVNKDGSLSVKPVDAIKFTDGAYSNTFFAFYDEQHYVNVGGSRQMIIDSWSIADGGNSCTITPVAAFDPTEALNAFAPAVTEVNPAPGYYETGIPSEITVTFDGEIKSLDFGMLRSDFTGFRGYMLSEEDYKVEGNKLTVTLPADYITNAPQAMLTLQVADANGRYTTYAANEDELMSGYVVLTYTAPVKSDLFTMSAVDPAAGEVEKLDVINVTFGEGMTYVGGFDTTKEAAVLNAAGDVVSKVTMEVVTESETDPDTDELVEWNTATVKFTLETPITEVGEYTFVIPEATVYNEGFYEDAEDFGVAWGAIYNPEIRIAYTVVEPVGIGAVTVKNVKSIYTLDGRKVNAKVGQKLNKGIYVIGGKKVFVK